MRTILATALAALAGQSVAQIQLDTRVVAGGFNDPVYVGQPKNPLDRDRLWVIEKAEFNPDSGGVFEEQFIARLRVLDRNTGDIRPESVLELFVAGGNEQGLLGLAFHPDFPNTPKIYLNYTRFGGDTVIEEQTIEYIGGEPFAVGGSERTLLVIDQPFGNHNAGWLDFSPIDGYLYISSGDGGSGGDPGNRSQNLGLLLGKMLRIDVNGDDFPDDPERNYAIPADNPFVNDTAARDEIWSYGLRNPYRNDFDDGIAPGNLGDLWMADVGQGRIEEINRQPAASPGGENYGWRCYEGSLAFNTGGCPPIADLTFPVFEYPHTGTGPIVGCSVTGGIAYGGCKLLGYTGAYFLTDFCSNEVVALLPDLTLLDLTDDLGFFGSNASSFGEDADGNLYIVSLNGIITEVVPGETVPACSDNCIASCSVADLAAPCGFLDLSDVDAFIGAFITGDDLADVAAPFGLIDLTDVDSFITSFLNGCP
ncbi:MAG: PQQ-dependent sugar dehydrogenase [Planctomycetota bacterium]